MNLLNYLYNNGINDNLSKELAALFINKGYHAGDFILSMGENTKVVCFIQKGFVRGFYLDEDGNDITKCFSKEGDWCCTYNYFSEKPSEYYIQALNDCTIAEINTDKLKYAIEKYTDVRHLYDKLFQQAFFIVEEKGTLFQKMTAKERYIYFIKNNPEIIKNVKQEYIASYLGITPSSLSRIKKEL